MLNRHQRIPKLDKVIRQKIGFKLGFEIIKFWLKSIIIDKNSTVFWKIRNKTCQIPKYFDSSTLTLTDNIEKHIREWFTQSETAQMGYSPLDSPCMAYITIFQDPTALNFILKKQSNILLFLTDYDKLFYCSNDFKNTIISII